MHVLICMKKFMFMSIRCIMWLKCFANLESKYVNKDG